jgi:putative ABC transport system permease protein
VSAASEIVAVSLMSLRSVPRRLVSSLVIVIAMVGVSGVFIAVLALSGGLAHTLATTGHRDRAIVLQGGTDAEGASILPRETVAKVMDAPGIQRAADGKPVLSVEALANVQIPLGSSEKEDSLTLRGVSFQFAALRPEIRLVEGRMMQPGLHELLVGRTAQARFGDTLSLGRRVRIVDVDWLIVGAFDSGGGAHDAELLTDAETMLGAYRRNSFNSVTVKLAGPGAFLTLRQALISDPTISVAVGPESYYYEQHSQVLAKFLGLIANFVGLVMAVGAIFAAMNTMYAAVDSRTTEIATLRAIGFGGGGLVVSILLEALLLALIGAAGGAALAWLLFNGDTVSTVGGAGIANVVFHLRIGAGLVVSGLAWGCVVGLVGGLFPAIRAVRMPVDAALRPV